MSIRAVLMVYDIPEGRSIGNPANFLRKRGGFQINLSAWVFKEEELPTTYIEGLREKGANVETVRFDEAEHDTIIRLARQALEREAEKIRAMLTDGVAKANARFEDAKKLESADKVEAAVNYIKGRIRAAKQRLASAVHASLVFSLTGDVDAAFKGIESAIASEQESFFIERAVDFAPKRKKRAEVKQ